MAWEIRGVGDKTLPHAIARAATTAAHAVQTVPGAGEDKLGKALGAYAGAWEKIADARATIDGYATDFVEGVNAVQAAGQDLAAVLAGRLTLMEAVLPQPAGFGVLAGRSGSGTALDAAGLDRLLALRLAQGSEGGLAALYAAGSVALSILACALGLLLGHALGGRLP